MEYCAFGTLADYMRTASLQIPTIRWLLGQLASALQSLHASNIMHRDLKPQNILLTTPQPLFFSRNGLRTSQAHPPAPLSADVDDLQLCDGAEVCATLNAFRQRRPPLPILKLADFGFARPHRGMFDLTQTLAGSPLYMAPEMLAYMSYL